MNIKQILEEYKDPNYKLFHQKICQTNYEILGIKIPILRNIAKKLLKEYSYQEILNNLDDSYYEYVMLQGIVIGNAKVSYEEKLNLIKMFISKIDNWGICDIFCGELKFIKFYKAEFLEFIQEFLNSDKEYYQRFGIVILLSYYIEDEYLEMVLNKMLEIKSEKYYVKMAISWCLSIALIKYFDKTIKFMDNHKNEFDSWTYNKALQKGRESLRISKEKKEILQKMKR